MSRHSSTSNPLPERGGRRKKKNKKKKTRELHVLFANHIRAPLLAHPDLVDPSRIDINPVADTKRLLGGTRVVWVGDGQLAPEDEVCGQARV